MYAVASLDEGMEWAADTFGVPAAYGGEHVDLGTRNALLSLGSTYLEIIGPVPFVKDPPPAPMQGWTKEAPEEAEPAELSALQRFISKFRKS